MNPASLASPTAAGFLLIASCGVAHDGYAESVEKLGGGIQIWDVLPPFFVSEMKTAEVVGLLKLQ